MLTERDRLLKGPPHGITWTTPYAVSESFDVAALPDDRPARHASSLLVWSAAGLIIVLVIAAIGLVFRPRRTSPSQAAAPTITTESPISRTLVIADVPLNTPLPTIEAPPTTDAGIDRPPDTPWPTASPSPVQTPLPPPTGVPPARPQQTPGSSGGPTGPTPIFGLTPQPVFTLGVIFPQTPGVQGTPVPGAVNLPADPILFVRGSHIYAIGSDGGGLVQVTQGAQRYFSPAWSPDRGRMVVGSDRNGNADLFVTAITSLLPSPITTDPAADSDPAWNWSGERIAFASTRSGGTDIYLVDSNGGNITRLTQDGAQDRYPTWSPVGGRVAFASTRDGGDFDLFVVNGNGSGLAQLTQNGVDDTHPAWSPDGTQIAFISSGDVHLLDIAGSTVTRLTTSGGVTGLSWSPDGRRIVFAAAGDLWLMEIGGSPARLTSGPTLDDSPAWAR